MIKNYSKNVESDVKFLIASESRLKILLELAREPLSMSQIKDVSSLPYPTISNNLSKLEEKGYLIKEEGKFFLENIGRIRLTNFMELYQTLNAIEISSEIFYKHDISMLTEKDMLNINKLENSFVETINNENVYNLESIKDEILLNADFLKFIMPLFHSGYLEIINKLLKNNIDIHLILPQDAFNAMSLKMNKKLIKEKLHCGQLKLSTRENINLELIVTGSAMSLTLFTDEGLLDQNRLLISHDINSVDWGLKTFENFTKINKSTAIKTKIGV